MDVEQGSSLQPEEPTTPTQQEESPTLTQPEEPTTPTQQEEPTTLTQQEESPGALCPAGGGATNSCSLLNPPKL